MRRTAMRRYVGGVLLLGALAITSLAAQRVPSVPRGYVDVAVTYNPMQSNTVSNKGIWLQGASAQLEGHFWRGLGVVADVAGTHAKNISSSGVGLDMVRATFGPRYTWLIPHRRLSIFAQGLLGEANGSACAQSRPTGSALSCRTA